ncbi:AT-rich interactive domain-containing protein 3B [Rhinophrynus dorsalis]
MVEKAGCGRESMPSLIPGGLNLTLSGNTQMHPKQGMKLEAVMEQLQKQQQQAARSMEERERQIRETQRLYTQQLAAQHAMKALPGSTSVVSGRTRLPVGPPQSASDLEDDEEMEGDESDEGDSFEEDDDDKVAQGSILAQKYIQAQREQQGISTPNPKGTVSQRPLTVKEEPPEEHFNPSPANLHKQAMEEHIKQENSSWCDDPDGRGREASRDFAKLYELDSDPKRKEFLDDLFVFMQKKGTPISRIPIMAKQLLDLYMLYKLVTEKGGLVEVINKKIWREITKGLNLPTSITSAAFTLRTQYMKYLYLYECEKKSLSSPAELQAAIDGNRREGRRPSYGSSSFSYSPTPAGAPTLLGAPKVPVPMLGVHPSTRISPVTSIKKGDSPASLIPGRMPMSGPPGTQQTQAGVRTASLEQLKERLETGEPPEKRTPRTPGEEQQRLMQQALQHNLISMARQIPMNLKINGKVAQDRQEGTLNLGTGSINMSIEINGTMYTVHLQVLLGAGLALLCFCLLLGCAICWHRSRRQHSSLSLCGQDKELPRQTYGGQELSEAPARSAAVPIPLCYQDVDGEITPKGEREEDDTPAQEGLNSVTSRRFHPRASLPSLHQFSSKKRRSLQRRSTVFGDCSSGGDRTRLVRVPLSRTEPSGLSRVKQKSQPLLHFTLFYSLAEESLIVTVTGLSNMPKRIHQKRDSWVRAYLLPGFIEPLPGPDGDSDVGQKFTFCQHNPEELRKLTLRLAVYARNKHSLKEGFIGEVLFPCSECDWNAQGTPGYTKELSTTKTKLKKSLSTMDVLCSPSSHPKSLGQVLILLQFQALASRIKVMVQKAENLCKLTRIPGAPDHFVSIRLVQESQVKDIKETRSVSGSNPVWNAPFLFDAPPEAMQEQILCLEFLIMQGRIYNRARVLGHVMIGAGSSEVGLAHWKEMYSRAPLECARWHTLQPEVF